MENIFQLSVRGPYGKANGQQDIYTEAGRKSRIIPGDLVDWSQQIQLKYGTSDP